MFKRKFGYMSIETQVEHFLCLKCGNTKLKLSGSNFQCPACQEIYPLNHEIADFLYNPIADTVKELKGMAMENGYDVNDLQKFKIKLTHDTPRLSQRLTNTINDYNQYYQQTVSNYEQAMNIIRNKYPSGKIRVLEIGSVFDYYFLEPFKKMGAECFALNIHYSYSNTEYFHEWPHKVLADMNNIPFNLETFDVVLISATSHHSNIPEKLISEINRILKPGGSCMMINDPIQGFIKSLGGQYDLVRHDHINENEYTIWRYYRAFKENNFKINSLFSEFYNQKLLGTKIHPKTRFASLARVVVYFWKINWIRNFCRNYLLFFAQSIFGFPLNVILEKPVK